MVAGVLLGHEGIGIGVSKIQFKTCNRAMAFGTKLKIRLTVDSTFGSLEFDKHGLRELVSDAVVEWLSSSYGRFRCLVGRSYCRHWAWSAAKTEKLGSG